MAHTVEGEKGGIVEMGYEVGVRRTGDRETSRDGMVKGDVWEPHVT